MTTTGTGGTYKTTKQQPWTALRAALIAGAVLLAIVIILVSSRWGAALGDDSYAYIKPARDVLAGNAMQLNPSFPPLLPYLLTGLGFLGLEPLIAIRLLNALLFGICVFLAFLIVYRLSSSFTFAFLGSVSIMISAGLIELFASAMSEPLYLVLVLTALACVLRYHESKSMIWLAASGIATGLALFTRYAGLSLLGTIGLFLLAASASSFKEKVRSILVFGVLSALPIAGYSIHNIFTIGRPVGHSGFSWALVKEFPLNLLLQNLWDWFIPARLVSGHEMQLSALLLGIIIALVLGYSIAHRRHLRSLWRLLFQSPALHLLGLFLLVNLLMLTLARGYFRGGDSFNPRYISPLQLVFLMMLFGFLGRLYHATGRGSSIVISTICLGLFAILAVRAMYTMQFLYRVGGGYASQRWHISETIAYLNHRPDTPVMSTGATGVYFWTDRMPVNISRSRDAAREFLCETGGFLVVIDSMPLEFYGIDPSSYLEGMVVEQDFSEGTIYTIDPLLCE